VSEDGTLLRYPWGEGFPPATKAGNFADSAAVALLARVLSNYTDGSVVTTRPGSFAPGPRGLFDLGGNAAEWCHDYYSVYSYDPQQTVLDPVGPSEGAHHVIRGSSWKDATITALRLSFRDYGDEARDDVGFRLARYADDGGGS
jgi:formylglycine-generating enzyme required for sulfatase activity